MQGTLTGCHNRGLASAACRLDAAYEAAETSSDYYSVKFHSYWF